MLNIAKNAQKILPGIEAGYISVHVVANNYCDFLDLKFSIGIKGIDTELIGVPLRFFMSTPRRVPIAAMIKVSKINGS